MHLNKDCAYVTGLLIIDVATCNNTPAIVSSLKILSKQLLNLEVFFNFLHPNNEIHETQY